MSAINKTLTYADRVDPAPGTLMGPSTDGRVWKVVGTEHADDFSTVTFELVNRAGDPT